MSTLGPSLESTAGRGVRVAASTKMTASVIPRLIERNAGEGTSMTAVSEISAVSPGEHDGLARGVHRHGGGVDGQSPWPRSAPRKRCTINSA